MCSGALKRSPPPSPPSGPVTPAGDYTKPAPMVLGSLLLELAAADDLAGFRRAVEIDGHDVGSAAAWYVRATGRMGLHQRTPLQIAALYGSNAVLGYLLSVIRTVDVSGPCGTDGTTALHCAAAGGAASAPNAVRLLLDASADVEALDAAGNRPADLIPKHALPISTSKSLETLLKASCSSLSSSPKVSSSPTKEKKEYPLDLTLPDIKNGIYGTDEFRMYSFKVKPCSRAYSHDWTECPFVHPGENARRRDPRKYLYSCVPCPEFRKGSCRNGDACEYAHGVFECWLHPAQYRTRLCKDETGCNRRVCFFAHKPEELRSVNPSTVSVSGGLVMSSPRAGGSVSSLDMAAAMMLMQPGSPKTPMSPSASSGMAASLWMNQTGGPMTPTAPLPSSRLKSTLSSRDIELDLELLGLENYQQKLIDEISNAASPRAKWAASTLAAAAGGSRPSDYSDLLGSVDPSLLTQFHGLSLKQTAAGAQYQSPTSIPMLSGYGGNMGSSSPMRSSSSIGLDHSLATALMNSRSSAFAKRSLSFMDRGAAARHSTLAAATTAAAAAATSGIPDWGSPSGKLDWGSPSGKLDWGIQGEELNKFRKSASFGFRNTTTNSGGLGTAAAPVKGSTFEEPDLSWVQSLVKDGPAAAAASPAGRLGHNQHDNQYHQINGGLDYHSSEMFSAWAAAEQLYLEQEQMVA